MALTQIAASGLEHGLINTIGNSVPDKGFALFSEKDRSSMDKKKKDSEKIVKARYLNSRGVNERLERPYMEYEGQPITMWRFLHNHVYELPKGLVDDVNKQMALPQRSEILDASGQPTKVNGPGEKLHLFVPVDF